MLLIVVACLAFATVPLAGGSLGRLPDLRLRGGGIALAAIALQTLVVTVIPAGSHALHVAAHMASYAMIALFAWINRRLPGLALLAAGGSMNLVAIAANGGVMPASHWAYRTAGLRVIDGEFINSAPVAHPHLLVFGDIFAVPAAVPLANVFSIGDVVLVAGVFVLAHAACGSRWSRLPAPRLVSARLIPAGGGASLLHLVVRDAGEVGGLLGNRLRLTALPGSVARGDEWHGGFAIHGDLPKSLRLDLGWRELDVLPSLRASASSPSITSRSPLPRAARRTLAASTASSSG